MGQSIKHRLARLEVLDERNLRLLLEAVLADNAAMRVDIAALDTALDALVTKMNSDAGITDTDYAGAAALTSTTATLEA